MMMFVIFFVVFSEMAQAQGSSPRCEKIAVPVCQNLGYNTTLMPNYMGHDNQREAARGLLEFGNLINHNCSSYLRLFVCSVFVPLCSEHVPGAIHACRGLCEEVKSSCLPALQRAGLPWPAKLECSGFPEPPNLCMQQPEEDFKDLTSGGSLTNFRPVSNSCPFGTLPGPNKRCLKKCYANEAYMANEKLFFKIWTIGWSSVCFIFTGFSLLTFFVQSKRFRWPARPVLFLSFCGFVRSAIFLLRWIFGPFTCLGEVTIEKSTDSLVCSSVALVLLYLNVAATLWWTVFCFGWFLSAAKEWSTEAIEKLSPKLHALIWTLSIVPLIASLIVQDISLYELTGFCKISNSLPVPIQLFFALCGFFLAVATSVALRKVREALSCYKTERVILRRLILRLALISTGIFIPLIASLICEFSANFYIATVGIGLRFLSEIVASLWVFSSKTFKSWNKMLKPTPKTKSTSLPISKV